MRLSSLKYVIPPDIIDGFRVDIKSDSVDVDISLLLSISTMKTLLNF